MVEILTIIGLIIVMIVIFLLFNMDNSNKKNILKKQYSIKHVNEVSFQKFAKFYGFNIPKTEKFNKKVDMTIELVNVKKEKSITEIANKINYDEGYTFVLLRYLKNKRVFGDLEINTKEKTIYECSKEDKELLDKYSPFIYNSHLQIEDMIPLLQNKGTDIAQLKQTIINELRYLDEKKLLNGIRIGQNAEKIIYYSVEKRKIEKVGIKVVVCPNCSAITYKKSDQQSVSCDYCHCKIEDKKEKK